MNPILKNYKVVITGASGDVGSALARAFVAAGARVAGLGWTRPPAEICEMSCQADLRSPVEIARAFTEIERVWGPVDIQINSAGEAFDALFLKTEAEEWEQIWRIHLLAAALATKAVLPGMMQQRSGVVLNISSLAAEHPRTGQAAYASAKAGMEAITRALAREMGGKGIRVNAIAPGFLAGSWLDRYSEEQKKKMLEEVPAGRLGRPEEVAALAVFLASPAAGYITGQVIGMDGGAGM